jgi:hypothetical protein
LTRKIGAGEDCHRLNAPRDCGKKQAEIGPSATIRLICHNSAIIWDWKPGDHTSGFGASPPPWARRSFELNKDFYYA